MCVLIYSTTFVPILSHSKKNWARYDKKCVLAFMSTTCYPYQVSIKLEISQQTLEKRSHLKHHENPSNGSRVFPCGQMDRRTDMTKLIVTFRNFLNAPTTRIPREKILTIFAKYFWRPLQLDALGKRPSRLALVKTFLRRCRVYRKMPSARSRGLRIQGFES
jgi:hypothetical protein